MADLERLASVETKLEFLKELMLEVRKDVKNLPTSNEYNKLDSRVQELEKARIKDAIKIGVSSGILGFLTALLTKFLIS